MRDEKSGIRNEGAADQKVWRREYWIRGEAAGPQLSTLNSQIFLRDSPIYTILYIKKALFHQKSAFFTAACGILPIDIVIDRNGPLLRGAAFFVAQRPL